MAWNIHWQCCFQSLNGTQYAVNICEQDYDGDIVQLTGSAEPFVTQEDDSDDIFTPIRMQTGYLRVIDPDGTLLADLIPQNNTERLVQLFHGTYTGTWPNGTFTHAADALDWQGFLQAQAYTQPWDGNASVLELPVKSLLGALEDVTIAEEYASLEKNVAALILAAFSQFGLQTTVDLRYIHVISDATDPVNTLLLPILQWSVFFSEETINNEGDSYNQLVGMSYSEALSSVMSLYGWQMRENGSDVYLVQYDAIQPYHDGLRMQTIEFTDLQSMAEGNLITKEQRDVPSANMLTSLTIRGADNVAGYVQGGRSAKVELDLGKGAQFGINLPQTTEDSTQPRTIEIEDETYQGGTVYVQVHEPRTNSQETFNFKHYAAHEASVEDIVTASTFEDCVETSVLDIQDVLFFDNPTHLEYDITTGCFPCRWASKLSSSLESPSLRNGMFFNVRPGAWSTAQEQYIKTSEAYAIKSLLDLDYNGGYINILFDVHMFYFIHGWALLQFSDFYKFNGYNPKIVCVAKLGDKYWNGTSWASSYATFTIEFNANGMVSNKTDDMNVEGTTGYFIPLDGTGVETFTLSIVNTSKLHGGEYDAHSFILDNLNVDYRYTRNIVESERSKNIYWQSITVSGFSEDKQIDLSVGTINNNVRYPVFIKSNSSTYIEQLTYRTRYYTTKNQRPELHLLERMVMQYKQVRRLFTAIVQRELSLMDTRYTYQERAYFGIHQQVNWRDDTEEVKFIEVS